MNENQERALKIISNMYKITEYNTVLVIILNELLIHLEYGMSSEPFHSEYEAALHPDETGLDSDELKRVTSSLIKCDDDMIHSFECEYIDWIRGEVSVWKKSLRHDLASQEAKLGSKTGREVVMPSVFIADDCLEQSLVCVSVKLIRLQQVICQKRTA